MHCLGCGSHTCWLEVVMAAANLCCSVMQATMAITLLQLVYIMQATCAAAAGCTCAVRMGARSGIQRMPRLLSTSYEGAAMVMTVLTIHLEPVQVLCFAC